MFTLLAFSPAPIVSPSSTISLSQLILNKGDLDKGGIKQSVRGGQIGFVLLPARAPHQSRRGPQHAWCLTA